MGDRVTHGNGRPSQPQEESAPTAPNAAGPQRTVQEQSSRMAVTSDASQLLSCRTGEKGGDVGVGGRTSVVGKRDVVPPCTTAAPSPDAAPLTGAAEAAGRRKSPLRGAGGGLVERYDRHSTAESSAPIAHSDDRHGEGTAAMGNTGTHPAGRGETPDEGRSGQGRGSRRKRVTRGYQLRIRREHEKQPGTSRRGRGARGPSTHVRALAVLPLPQSTAATTNATATTLNNHNLRPSTRAYIQVVHAGNAFNKKGTAGTASSFMTRKSSWQHPTAGRQAQAQRRPQWQKTPRARRHPRPGARQRSGSTQQPCQTGGAPRG